MRRGKYIHARLGSGRHLLIHLRMSGRLHLAKSGDERSRHEHVVLHLSGGLDLRLHDTRKFARVFLVEEAQGLLGGLGIEPLGEAFTPARLAALLRARQRRLKPLLLDQGVIAGLGNIYVDEALWEAGLHPCRLGADLSEAEIARLHRAIPGVLKSGLANRGTSLGKGQGNFSSVGRRPGENGTFLKVFRRTGEPCPRCGTPIVRLVVAQRGTHICPCCQAEPVSQVIPRRA